MSDRDRPARPWDLFNKNIQKVGEDLRQERMEICKSCKFFVSLTQQCTKCGCIMPAKTTLPNASCPIHKWGAVDENGIPFKKEVDEK